ncbi:MAG: hypothetical protein HY899_03515 [Deltaproteobacteria bacterium]|nr:hypothetical protein [Deltaproteobacteria bacterium]
MNFPDRSTLHLTHFGRRSGKRFQVKIWYVILDGDVWIGSLDVERNWVRNLGATGRGEIDFGDGPIACSCRRIHEETALARFREAIREKHPILSRVIAPLVRRKRPGAFRLTLDAQDPSH